MSENLEHKILEAAKKIFVKNGFSATTMADIAKLAKISRPTLNYYFRTKERLFEAIFEDVMNNFLPEFETIVSQKRPVLEKIEAYIECYSKAIQKNPYFPKFIVSEIQRDPQQVFQTLKRLIAEQSTLSKFIKEYETAKKNKTIQNIPLETVILTVASLLIFPFLVNDLFVKVFPERNILDNRTIDKRTALATSTVKTMLTPPKSKKR